MTNKALSGTGKLVADDVEEMTTNGPLLRNMAHNLL